MDTPLSIKIQDGLGESCVRILYNHKTVWLKVLTFNLVGIRKKTPLAGSKKQFLIKKVQKNF